MEPVAYRLRGALRLVLSESPQLRMSSFCLSVAGDSREPRRPGMLLGVAHSWK